MIERDPLSREIGCDLYRVVPSGSPDTSQTNRDRRRRYLFAAGLHPRGRLDRWLDASLDRGGFLADRRRSGTSFAARGGAIRAGIPGRSRGQDEDLLPSRSDPVEETRGEVLIVTERVEMVLPLRHGLLAHRYDLVWISNFWLAMSYLHSSRFVSLIFDMDVESVEERFVMYFLEEYEKISSGRKIFLSSGTTSVAIQRQLQEKGHLVLDRHAPPEDLVRRVAQGSGVSG